LKFSLSDIINLNISVSIGTSSVLFITVPLILSAFTHL
jgi:hypothetical protein